MWWCFICRSSPHEAGGGTRTQVLTEQAPGKPDQTRSIPRKGYICRASLRKTGAGQERNNMDYKSRRWKRLREKILRRDRYCCRESKRYGRMVEATTAHHVWPVEQYPEYQWCEWNLIALSNEEHNAMHDRETGELTDKGEYWRRKITPPPPTPQENTT